MVIETTLVIRIALSDESDFDWVRNKVMPAVEEALEENAARLDGEYDVSWEME